jgi:very-short-patch-repair endonuclease
MVKATPTDLLANAKNPPPPSRGRTRARALRKNATEAERKLWFELREFTKAGFYFRRQAPIGKYIVDIACLKSKLIVELDGGHHTEDQQRVHDITRDKWLENEGFNVLRFWNEQVFKDKKTVLDAIYSALPLEGGGGRAATGGGDSPHEGITQ